MMIILIIYDYCVSSIHLPHQHIQYPTFADMQQISDMQLSEATIIPLFPNTMSQHQYTTKEIPFINNDIKKMELKL